MQQNLLCAEYSIRARPLIIWRAAWSGFSQTDFFLTSSDQ